MALLQISEPGQSTAPHHHNLACGIDLGTTNSLVASVMSGQTRLISDQNNNSMLPSVVHYGQDKMTVGADAYQYTKTDPTNTILSVKRYMGVDYSEASEFKNLPYKLVKNGNNVSFETSIGDVSAIEVSASILSALKRPSRGCTRR